MAPEQAQPARIGIIAGAGCFPFLVADGARSAGREVVVIGLRGLADPELRRRADRFYWSGVVRLGRWIRIFRREDVSRVILAGSVRKSDMYGRLRLLRYVPDWTSIKVWYRRTADKRNDSILLAATDEMARAGFVVQSSVEYCPEALAHAGRLTRRSPDPDQDKDIDFGWRVAKEIGRLDIGQSVAVKEQEVIAVEAIEGTDAMIRRAGQLCRAGGWVLVKVAKPQQDMRFDVPTVGPDTIEHLAAAKSGALVIEAGKTLLIQPEKMIQLADRYGIAVIARRDQAQ